MAELCPETASCRAGPRRKGGFGRKPNEIEVFGISICKARCYTCPSDVAMAHLTFQFTFTKKLKYPLAGGERFLVKYGCKAK